MSSDLTSIESQFNLNASKSNFESRYEFGNFRLDGAILMLYRDGEAVALAPKVVETLLALIERRGEIVSKDEMMKRLWADAFVEDANLTQNIYLLRKTLGKTPDGRDLIETFRRRGYRFNGEICRPSNGDATEKSSARARGETIDPPRSVAEMRRSDLAGNRFFGRRVWLSAAIFGTLLLVAVFASTQFFRREKNVAAIIAPAPNVSLKRLTPDVYAFNPAISPDGEHLAYAEIKDDQYSLWLKKIASGEAVQLLPPLAEGYKGLQFSPDGRELYFLTKRENAPNHVIAHVSLAERNAPPQVIVDDAISPPAVAPDGKRIAYINGKGNLLIVNRDGGDRRVLKERDNKTVWFNGWDSLMSWAPDGGSVAVCGGSRKDGRGISELIEITVGDGTERRISTPANWQEMSDVAWRADKSGLFVNARETLGQPFQIWSVAYSGGAAKRITNDLHDYNWFTVTADSRLIVAEQFLGNLNIWTAPAADAQNVKQMTFGKAAKDGVSGIAVLPDGKIVYSSIRSGNLDLWMMDADGGQRQLTVNAGTQNSRPRATPDGRYIVFVSSRTGTSRIWRMDADGGNAKQLTGGEAYETRPAISPDGLSVYYTLDEGNDNSSIWKVSIDGGDAVRVSAHSQSWAAAASPDGKFIAYNHNDIGAAQPWKIGVMSAAGGAPLKLFEPQVHHGILDWTADSSSIVYINTLEKSNLWRQPIDGSPPRRLTSFDSERILNFAFAPDYQKIYFSRGSDSTEAVLIGDFSPQASESK